jgi:uncharacterized protein (DUF305 family)
MSKTRSILIATVLVSALGAGTWAAMSRADSHGAHGDAAGHAQADHGAMHGAVRGEDGASPADVSPSTQAYIEASDLMHAGMAIEFTGNADIDFAKGMIPHHEGAIGMARVVLEHGEDPEIRALAEEIIAAQEGEITFLREWLAARGH